LEKTRSLIGKMLVTILILFAFSAPFMSSASALYPAATSTIPTTTVFLTPSRINGTTVGQTINVTAEITGATDLFAWQVGLIWSNTTVAECTAVTNGSILNPIPSGESYEIPGTTDNTNGIVTAYGWSLFYPYNINGSGAMVKFTFKIKAIGFSDVHINNMIPVDINSNVIPCNLIDYFTAVRGGQQYIVRLQGNPMESAGLAGFGAMSVTSPSNKVGYEGNMTFEINGTSDDVSSFAYFNATFPNMLMNCSSPDNWIVELGGVVQSGVLVKTGAQSTTVSLSTTSDSSFVYYPFSSGKITLMINILSNSAAVPELASTFSSALLAIVLMLATLAAALFIVTSRSRKPKG